MKYPESLKTLITYLKKLPAVGTRTAERFAFELLGWQGEELESLGDLLKVVRSQIPPCSSCGCLTDAGSCRFCDPATREKSSLCIIGSARDAYAFEETKSYRGLYHVIEHLLSPLDGRHAHQLRIDRIQERIEQNGVREVIIALDSTLEGDTTSLYLKNHLAKPNLSISRLAFGLPVGSSLETIDGGTLLRSLQGRQLL